MPTCAGSITSPGTAWAMPEASMACITELPAGTVT